MIIVNYLWCKEGIIVMFKKNIYLIEIYAHVFIDEIMWQQGTALKKTQWWGWGKWGPRWDKIGDSWYLNMGIVHVGILYHITLYIILYIIFYIINFYIKNGLFLELFSSNFTGFASYNQICLFLIDQWQTYSFWQSYHYPWRVDLLCGPQNLIKSEKYNLHSICAHRF